jgi:uncharacterized protein YqgC (DUF456 family)
MDGLLLVLGFICMLVGILGSLLPVLPGPAIRWLGILLLYCTKAVPMNYWVIGSTLLITVILVILDYIIPAGGTKRSGGSIYGIWGTNIGLVFGLLAPIPFGFLIRPFLGALIGELVFDPNNHNRAFKAATGSLVGFLASTFIQFLVCVLFLGLFISLVWHNCALFF